MTLTWCDLCQGFWTVSRRFSSWSGGRCCGPVVVEHFGRGAVSQRTVEPFAVVEDLDVVRDREPGGGSGGEGSAVVHLVLQRCEERLGCGVVPAHPGPADTGPDVDAPAVLGEVGRRVLASTGGVEHRTGVEAADFAEHCRRIDVRP